MIAGRDVRTGKPVTVTLKGDRIAAVKARKGGFSLPWIGPGLVDLQLNGYGGLDFNAPPLPDDLPGKVTRLLWREGITSYFATVITHAPDAIEACVRGIARARARDADAAAGIAGIHLEGPFISPEDGPRGAHDREHVRPPDWDLFRRWQDAAQGAIRIVTLSPEWPGSGDFIRRLAESGVTPSIGHTGASPEQVRAAVAAGATMSTHLGNGAHLTLPRHPNYLWEQLAADELAACIIADGFHLPDSVIKVILRTKGRRAMLASDAVYLAGLLPGTYRAPIGGCVVLTPEGRLHLESNPKLLAGSVRMLTDAVGHLARSGLAPLGEAWEMASTRPAAAMELACRKGLAAGAPADLACFEEDGKRLRVVRTIKAGRTVYGG